MDWSFPPLLPATRNLLIACVVAFVAYTVLRGGMGLPLDAWLGLSSLPSVGWSWQWATHWTIGGGTGGAAFRKLVELVFIYLMGTQYEALAGQRHTYGIAGAGVVGAALGTMVTGWLTPGPPWGDLALTSALMTALAVRMAGRPMRAPFMPPMSAWIFVLVFGAVALLDSVWWHLGQIFGSYAGAVGGAYLYERFVARRPEREPAPPTRDGVRRKKASHPFRVIEGGGQSSDDDDKPKYLN